MLFLAFFTGRGGGCPAVAAAAAASAGVSYSFGEARCEVGIAGDDGNGDISEAVVIVVWFGLVWLVLHVGVLYYFVIVNVLSPFT